MLQAIYIAVLILQIIWMVRVCKGKSRFRWLLALNVLSLAAALFLTNYYNNLPGTGPMVGISYFAETIFSMIFSLVYGVTLLISGLCAIFHKK